MSKYLELVEGVFAQEHLDKQQNQNPYVAYSIKDGKVIYTIIPKEDGTMYTVMLFHKKDISNLEYKAVDLGLPSGLKWADRNVGATSVDDLGSYFQWGDIEPITLGTCDVTAAELAEMLNPLLGPAVGMEITADNIDEILEMMGIIGNDLTEAGPVGVKDKVFDWSDYFDTNDGGNTFNKYNNNGGLTILESIDDAATTHMGSPYRMPTKDEIRELIDNTTQMFVDLDGNEYNEQNVYDNNAIEPGNLKGIKFTSTNGNGNSIFIPASGVMFDTSIGRIYELVVIYTSILTDANDLPRYRVWGCNVNDSYDTIVFRYNGVPIRGVQA